VVCLLHERTNFALDDLTFVDQHFPPHLNRDSIWRILKAEGLNRRRPAASKRLARGTGSFGTMTSASSISKSSSCKCFKRRCQVGADGAVTGLRLVMASRGGRNSGHISPGAECGVTNGPVCSDGQAVAKELEVIVDPAVCGEETLHVAR